MKMSKDDRYKVKLLEKRIDDGDLEAMMEYAQMFQCKFPEEITETVLEKIVNCYETCMDAGNLTAALNLGAMYYEGVFVTRDYKKAIHYYELATESDDFETQIRAWTNLGYCYYYGRDIPVDDEKAYNCYMCAAVQRDANALYKIGDMYRYGRYVKKDEKMALKFYEQALEEVYPNDPAYSDIVKRIGEFSLYGIGMEKDAFRALELLSEAEIKTYKKIRERDPFAVSLLPKIQRMLNEAKFQVEEELSL